MSSTLRITGLVLVLLLLPETAEMQGVTLPNANPCPLGGILPCGSGGASGAQTFITRLFGQARLLMVGILSLAFFYYGVRLVIDNGDESAIGDAKNAYSYAIAGAVIAAGAGLIVSGFGSTGAGGTFVNAGPVATLLNSVISYMRLAVGVSVVVLITLQGMQLITSSGEDSSREAVKKRLFYGLVGVVVVLTAGSIANAVTGSGPTPIVTEIAGIINYVLAVVAALSVLGFLAGGAFILLSVDESLKDRGKKTITTSAIAFAVAASSYIIVTYFIAV